MNPPQSLRDPRADKAVVDPLVEWAREHRAAIDRNNTPGEIHDDDTDDYLMNVIMPLEDKLGRTRPTTREGMIAALDVAAREERAYQCDPPSGTAAMVIGVIENARDALKAGVGMAEDAGPDPLVTLWAEWLNARDALPPEEMNKEESDRFMNEMGERVQAFEDQLIAEPPKTLAGAHVQLDFLLYWQTVGLPTDERGYFARLRESVNRNLAALAAGQPVAPEPLVSLWSEWAMLRNTRAPQGVDFEGEERFNEDLSDRMMALEFQIIAARAETQTGALVQLAIANFYAEHGTPYDAKPLLVDLRKSIESDLRGVAAGQGGAS